MPITITIQAASDAVMTTTNSLNGTALADSDLRKAYGLPNQYIGTDKKVHLIDTPRWDKIDPAEGVGQTKVISSVRKVVGYQSWMGDDLNDVAQLTTTIGVHRPATTTAFQLRCDEISHDVSDMATIAPMPSTDNRENSAEESGTPGQLFNLVLGLGMRTETIKMSGALVDEGEITAENPRKQVLMNIARMQYFKTGRAGSKSWGGTASGPLNPRSYPCLTIFDTSIGTSGQFDHIGRQPNGLNLSYRGIIKSLSFRQEGGRPNQWFWTMEFAVVQNEHSHANLQTQGLKAGLLTINRIRLVNASGTPFTASEIAAGVQGKIHDSTTEGEAGTAYIEVRVAQDLQIPVYDEITEDRILTKYQYPANFQSIFITNSNSNPKIDGRYDIRDIDPIGDEFNAARTFRLGFVLSEDAPTLLNGFYRHRGDTSFNEPQLDQTFTSFTDGTSGYVSFGADNGNVGGGSASLITHNFDAAPADSGELDADYDPADL